MRQLLLKMINENASGQCLMNRLKIESEEIAVNLGSCQKLAGSVMLQKEIS